MFGLWGNSSNQRQSGSKPSSRKANPGAYDPASFDFGSLLAGEGEDAFGEDNFNLEDPELLKQLQDLTVGTTPKSKPSAAKPKPKPPSIPELDINTLAQLAAAENEDEEVELTEEDMNDPHFLSQLDALSSPDSKKEQSDNSQPPAQLVAPSLVSQSALHEITPESPNVSHKNIYQIDNKSPTVLPQHNESQQKNETLVDFSEERGFRITLPRKTPAQPLMPEDLMGLSFASESAGIPEANPSVSAASPLDVTVSSEISSSSPVSAPIEPQQSSSKEQTSPLLKDSQSPITSKVPISKDDDIWSDPALMEQRIKELKVTALTKKRAGDQVGALEALKQAKLLESRKGEVAVTATATEKVEKRIEKEEPSQPAQPLPIAKKEEPKEVSMPKNTAESDTMELLTVLKNRIKQYKTAAVHYNRAGNLTLAKNMLREAKRIEAITEDLNNGRVDFGSVIVPPEPDMTISKPVEQDSEVSIDQSDVDSDYPLLESKLQAQIDGLTNLATYLHKTGGSKSAEYTQYIQLRDSFIADLQALKSYRSRGKQVPGFHYEMVAIRQVVVHADVGPNEMMVEVLRGLGLGNKEIPGGSVEAFVTFDLGGWPPGEGMAMKGETSTAARGMDPEFNHKIVVSIERNKPFIRYVTRGKIIFEVFHSRYVGFGLLRKPVNLGRIQVKLDPLLNSTEVHGVFNLVDMNRKPVGGQLEVRIRLRVPLQGQEILVKHDKWLIVDDFNTGIAGLLEGLVVKSPAVTNAPAPAGLKTPVSVSNTPVKGAISTPPKVTTSQNPTTSISASKVAPKKDELSGTPVASTPSTDDELEQAIDELNSIDHMVSNLVLEQELDILQSQIANYSAQNKPIPDELTDRQSQLQIKMNLLVIQVQTGALTMDAYIEQVKSRIERDKKIALIFKRRGRKEEAIKALSRAKVMQSEVDEVMKAMAEGDLDM